MRSQARRYREFLVNHPDVLIADVCFSANTGRIDRCNAIAEPLLGKSLLDFLYPATVGEIPTDETAYCTALFTLQIALRELWKSWVNVN